MNDLPRGWEWATLGEVGEYLNGRGFKKSEWATAGRPIIRIQNLTGSGSSFNYFAGEADDRHVVRNGDLLVSWAATLGVFVWRGPEAVLNQHIFKVRSYVHPTFHRHLLSHVLDDLQRQTHGSGMVHITKGRFDATRVPVPPRAEQERIVTPIEEYLSRLEAASNTFAAASRRVEILQQRIIDESIEGESVPLGTLLREPLRNGLSAPVSAHGSVRVVTLTAVTQAEFTEANTKLIDYPERSVDDLWMEPGDVFVQRSNTPELVGTAAMYRGDPKWAIFPDLLIRVRTGGRIEPDYLELVLRSTQLRSYFRRAAQGIAGSMPKISQPVVEEAPVPLPAPSRQQQMTRTARRQLEAMHRAYDDLSSLRTKLRGLRRSILAAAFSGELVPQDPSDEPASVLLERIRAERAAPAPAQRRRAKVSS